MQAITAHTQAVRPSRRGFTLIELLVVVAIIAVLMAILLPSLKNARDQAKGVKCISNMRSLSMMVMQYAQENNDYAIPNGSNSSMLPTPWFWKTITGTYGNQSSPLVDMFGYENVNKLRNCPSGKGVLSPAIYMTGQGENPQNYWLLTKMILVRGPATVVMFSETPTTAERPGQSNQAVYGSQLAYLLEQRHGNKNAFSFMDGHAELISKWPSTSGFPTEGYWRKTYMYP